jgi:hypothetical protein
MQSLRHTRKHLRDNGNKSSKKWARKAFFYVVPDYLDLRGGLSARQFSDCPGPLCGLFDGTHLTNNSERRTVRGLHRTIHRSLSRKHTETNRFWTLLSYERRTIRGFGPNCLPVKNVKTHSETRVLECSTLTPGLSMSRGRTVCEPQKTKNRGDTKIALSLYFPICNQIFTNCHETW